MADESAKPVQLPPKYYLDYFEYLLEFVQNMYGPLLVPSEVLFLEQFRQLSEDGRCLFVRLSNRKGSFFKVDELAYEEIRDLPSALNELTAAGFTEAVSSEHAPETERILSLLTKPSLLQLTSRLYPELMPLKSIRKPDLLRWLLHTYPPELLLDAVTVSENLVKVNRETEVMMMKFLFFGNRHEDMTEFVIRDLGHVRFQSFEEASFTVKFQNRREIDDSLTISLLHETFQTFTQTHPPEDVHSWFIHWYERFARDMSPVTQGSLHRLILKIAAWLERQKLYEQALMLYQLTDAAPSRERRARLLLRLGLAEEARQLCQEIRSAPQNADEHYFGSDFLRKLEKSQKRIVKQTTEALQAGELIPVSETYRYQVEQGAAAYYQSLGYDAVFSENLPWRALFGLLFWDIIYDTNVQAIHHPLQRVPSDFFLPDFYLKRKDALQLRLKHLDTSEKLARVLRQTYAEKQGIANVMVSWYDNLLPITLTLVRLLSVPQLHAILLEMATDLREKARGFPDLLLWKTTDYCLVEVKSPTDHLSSRQLYWQHFLQRLEVPCKIAKVTWVP